MKNPKNSKRTYFYTDFLGSIVVFCSVFSTRGVERRWVGHFTRGIIMRVYEILQRKGDSVYTILPTATLATAVKQMINYNCGSLLVTELGAILGIITERLILSAIDGAAKNLDDLLVSEYMNRNLVTGNPADDVSEIMGMMTTHRVRHLPILDNGRLAGMISAGDVVKAQFDLLAVENHFLKAYIQG